VGAKRQVTLPREVTRKLRLNEGDDLELRVQDGRIELVPLALIPRDQLWFWTPEWQAMEREADLDKVAGRVKTFRSAKKLIASLKK
jgi:AbrB family looped-hinge helix DNA binding protein